MTFYVGQKVVCVDDKNRTVFRPGTEEFITCGSVYVIRWLGFLDREPVLRLEGVVRPSYARIPEWSDYPFAIDRFRPVVERKTDISIFTKMLTPNKESIDA